MATPTTKNLSTKICFFGTYDENFSSNKIILDGLREANIEVLEVHHQVPLTRLNKDDDTALSALIKRLLPKFTLIGLSIRFFRQIKTCDAIFVGYPGHLDLVFAWVVSLLTRVPLVFYPIIVLSSVFTHNVNLLTEASWRTKLLVFFEKCIYKLPKLLLADTPFQKDYFVLAFGVDSDKIGVLPLGADPEAYAYIGLEEKKETVTVTYYGLFNPVHGVEYLIEAANLLKNEENITFELIGCGPTYEENYNKVKQYNLPNVTFYPDVTEKTATPYLARADIFIGFLKDEPPIYLSIPNKVFQGLSLGKVILTADTPVARSMFSSNDQVLLCKPSDAQALAETLKKAASDRLKLTEIAKNGHQRFLAEFTPKKIAESLVSQIKTFTR